MPFIHKSYGTLYDVIVCYDIIHTSNNYLAHSNLLTMENRSAQGRSARNKKYFHIGMIFQEYLIVQYLPLTASGMRHLLQDIAINLGCCLESLLIHVNQIE